MKPAPQAELFPSTEILVASGHAVTELLERLAKEGRRVHVLEWVGVGTARLEVEVKESHEP